jgi:hypothetical protein
VKRIFNAKAPRKSCPRFWWQQRNRSRHRQTLVEEGAFVYITARRQTGLDKAALLIGRDVTAVRGDVSNLTDLDRL